MFEKLRALEATRSLSAANVEKQAKVDWKVNVDAENASFKRGAKTNCSF